MLHTIVEGEPGIFPEPVARIMRGIGGLFRRRDDGAATSPASDRPSAEPAPSDRAQDRGARPGDDPDPHDPDAHSGDSR